MPHPVPIILPDWSTLDTQSRRAIFEPLWRDGVSARDIAYLHFKNATRNAVLGAVHRAKLPLKIKLTPQRAKIVRKPVAPRIVQVIPEPEPELDHQSVLDMINVGRPPLAGTVPIDILALPRRTGVLCRFPVIGGYCGQDSGEKVYCAAHMAIAFRPTDKIKVPKEARL